MQSETITSTGMDEQDYPDDDHGESSVMNTNSFFAEKSTVISLIQLMLETDKSSEGVLKDHFNAISKILIKYQEQPTVLNSSLAELTEPLTQRLADILLWAVPMSSDSLSQVLRSCFHL